MESKRPGPHGEPGNVKCQHSPCSHTEILVDAGCAGWPEAADCVQGTPWPVGSKKRIIMLNKISNVY